MLKGQFACDDRDLVQARAALEEAGRQARAANDIALRAGCVLFVIRLATPVGLRLH